MFDFANSSYTTVIITVVYSVFFTSTIVPEGSSFRNSYWSAALVLGMGIALVASPFIGAVCDFSGRKKRFLVGSAAVCAVATAGLGLVGPGEVVAGIVLVAVSYAAFMIGECFCASFLTDLATRESMGRISGIGWALGYMGGLASLVLVIVLVTADPDDLPRHVAQNQAAAALTGVFFLVAALPTFFLLKNRARPAPGFEGAPTRALLRAGLAEFRETWKTVRNYPILFRFLVAFTVYMAGLYVVVDFVAIYAKHEVALTHGEIRAVFLVVQLSAALGALAFGFLDSILGPKRNVLLTLVVWVASVAAIFEIDDLASILGVPRSTVFFGIALLAGSAIGATQSSSRAVVGLLAPPERSAQMFGFWGTCCRIANLFAMAYGPLADLLGSMRWALFLVIGFFVAGGVLLAGTPVERGIEEAGKGTGR